MFAWCELFANYSLEYSKYNHKKYITHQKKMSLLSLPLFANHVLVRHEKLNVSRKARQKHYLDAFLVDTLT